VTIAEPGCGFGETRLFERCIPSPGFLEGVCRTQEAAHGPLLGSVGVSPHGGCAVGRHRQTQILANGSATVPKLGEAREIIIRAGASGTPPSRRDNPPPPGIG